MKERRDYLSNLLLLKEIAEILNNSISLQEVLTEALPRLLKVTKFENGWIFLMNEKGDLELKTSVHLPPALLNEKEKPMCGQDCYCIERFQDGRLQKAVNVVECKRLKRAKDNDWGNTYGLTHHASVALKSGNENFGILNVASTGKEYFKEEELALLEAVAFQMGTTIKRIRLSEKSRRLAVHEERNRLAQDLHDSVNQLLFSVNLLAKSGLSSKKRENSLKLFQEIHMIAEKAQTEMKTLIWQLHPKGLEKGLVCALSAYGDMHKVNVRSNVEGTATIPKHIEEHLWRIGQEAINNCKKYAGQMEITINYYFHENKIEMSIEDNGNGFDYNPNIEIPTNGISNMKSRVKVLQGDFQFFSKLGKGTLIKVSIPY
ncbi:MULTISPECIES: GAF domain-containing sensor histidine kinase [Bacillus]|uniref:GAF domain-containing sensor histidine kinase n=1 Tax=Bacillus TaxID=1386 RepID=UPI0002F3B260|nr:MULTISPECIES: GAF domain-containing sensor histidine kinase [Bacillus]